MKNTIKTAMAVLVLTLSAQSSHALIMKEPNFIGQDCREIFECTVEIAMELTTSLPTFIVGDDGQKEVNELKVSAARMVLKSKNATAEQKEKARDVFREIAE